MHCKMSMVIFTHNNGHLSACLISQQLAGTEEIYKGQLEW